MSGVRFFMFLVALPALIFLGHDLYLFYLHQENGFIFSSAGFLWTSYNPASFRWVKDNVSLEHWQTIQFILQQKAFYTGLGFSFAMYFLLGILQLFRIWPFSGRGRAFSRGTSRLSDLLARGDKPKKKYSAKNKL